MYFSCVSRLKPNTKSQNLTQSDLVFSLHFLLLFCLQQQVPDLYSHLLELQLEAHMYASQWFLTLFTAKFPLYLVYRILDLFLCNGINTVFHVAIALLKVRVCNGCPTMYNCCEMRLKELSL